MQSIINRIITNNFQDFAGTRVGGKIVLSDALINEVMQLGLQSMQTPGDNEEPSPDAPNIEKIDINKLFKQLKFDQLAFSSESERVTISVKGELKTQPKPLGSDS